VKPLPLSLLFALALVPGAALMLLPDGPGRTGFICGLAGAVLGLLGHFAGRWLGSR